MGVDNIRKTQLIDFLYNRNISNINFPKTTEWKDLLTELGEIYTEEGRLESFIEVYKKLGKQPSEEQLIKIGVKCREKGWLTSAAKAFEMAGYVEGLREIANEWLKKGCVKQATDIYKKLDDEKMLNFLKQFLP